MKIYISSRFPLPALRLDVLRLPSFRLTSLVSLKLLLVLSVAASIFTSGATSLCAQDAPDPDASPVSNAPPPPPTPHMPKTTFNITTTRVDLFFTVRDSHGALIPGLKSGDCTVAEDKVPQTIKNFEAQNNLPLTLGMLIDTSGSMQRVLPMEKDAGAEFFRSVLKQKDEAFIISFDVNVDLLADYTNNARELERALNHAKINTGGGSGGVPGIGQGPVDISHPKGTILFDAVYVASREKMKTETGRKALILISDGQDEGSEEKLKDAIEAAQKSNVIVYVLWVVDRGLWGGGGGGFGWVGDSDMQKLARETGGRVIDVGTSSKKMEDAFAQIEDELRTQYLITYAPLNTTMDGKFRNIAVSCKSEGKDLKVQARKGYYALGAGDDSNGP